MADQFSGNLLSSRAIYPSRFIPYIAILCLAKLCRAFGIFLSFDLLKVTHVAQFLFITKAGSSIFLILLQKPFTSGEKITKRQCMRIVRHAFFGCVISVLWLLGLTLCGPLRTILLYEHSDMVVIAGASALFTSVGTPAKLRGAVFWLLAVLGILLFDHDDLDEHLKEPPGHHGHSGVLTHLFDHMTDLTGLSDHKGGVVLVFIALCLSVGYHSATKRLSVDVGGAKRLNALSTVASALILAPWALFVFITKESQVVSWLYMCLPMLLVILLVFVVDYYIEAACVNRIELARTKRIGTMAIFASGLVLSCFWSHPFISQVTSLQRLQDITIEEHVLSGGVVFSFVLFMFATHILTGQSRASYKGSFVGYSAAGLPLYSFTGNALHKTSQSVLHVLKTGLRQILEESDSRRIFYFLLINLFFTFIELVYGAWTNSLGLISDGFHMFFDCSALVMGLYASLMSRWKATRIFSYGYDRVEILSGFINALFLMVIAFFVFCAACSRMFDPPEIKTERLLAVSVIGFCVNLVGIFAFSHGHSHGGGHGHSHGDSHSHSHGGHGHSHGSHGHSHGGGGHQSHSKGGEGHSQSPSDLNTNMQGVFLHVLADTLGSVGVIISTLLIENLGWKIADPICSMFIAVLIFASVVPLVKQTCSVLLLRTPEELQTSLGLTLQHVLAVEGVLSYSQEHFWRHSSRVVCGTIHIQARPEVSEQKMINQITHLMKEAGVNNISVQVEKESYFQHLSGLGYRVDQASWVRHFTAGHCEDNPSFIKAI